MPEHSTSPAGPRMPLSGRRVIELGELLAGPFIGTLLGEFGAEVIKIERPGRGDVLRQFGPVVGGQSLYWLASARNKKSVVLDLEAEAGRTVLKDLIAKCDVLIDSLRPGTLDRWGLDDAWLSAQHPGLIIVHASAFGRQGPYKAKGGYDPIAQGFSGLSHVTGEADGPPMRAGGAVPVCDFMTGLAGALGAVLGLYVRDATADGKGQSVDIALYDMAFRMLGPLLANFDLTGEIWERDGNHSLGGAPTGHFRTRDGHWICTSVQNSEQFGRLAQLVGRPEWPSDRRFADLRARTAHRDAIEEVVAEWIASRSRSEVIEAFEKSGLVIGPINSVADLAIDPHLEHRSTFWDDDPDVGRHRQPKVAPILARTPGQVCSRAPRIGENTEEVLKSLLSYSNAKLVQLASKGAIEHPELEPIQARQG
ncbi:MAG: CaiB/BaiF CoA transferase family protein [Methyloligellaceae bacterium]